MALVVVVVVVQVFWKPQNLIQRWRTENKGEEELLETNSSEGEEQFSCNQIQMIPNVAVALDWKSTTKMKMWFLGAPDLTDPEHATPGPASLKKKRSS